MVKLKKQNKKNPYKLEPGKTLEQAWTNVRHISIFRSNKLVGVSTPMYWLTSALTHAFHCLVMK